MRSAWLGREHDERGEDDAADRRPARPPRMVRGQLAPAERARAGEHGEQRGRAAAGSGRGSAGPAAASTQKAPMATKPGRDRQRGSPAHEREDEDPARRRAEQARLAQDLAEAPRDGQRHVVEAGDALEVLRVALRVEERVQRVAGDHEVVRHPQHGRGERPRQQPRRPASRRRRRARSPTPPGAAARRGRAARGRARVLLARLGEDRAQYEHDVRDVEVGAHAEAEHRHAGKDQRRAATTPAAGPNQCAPSS